MSKIEKDASTLALSEAVVLVAALGGHLWFQLPVFQALLLPSGGFRALALLDYFLTQ